MSKKVDNGCPRGKQNFDQYNGARFYFSFNQAHIHNSISWKKFQQGDRPMDRWMDGPTE